MKFTKTILSMILAIAMVLSFVPGNVAAKESNAPLTPNELREKYGAITFEAYNIGQGFLIEPSLYAKEGKSVGDITVEFLTANDISYEGSTSYFGGFAFDDTTKAVYPDYMEPYFGELEDTGDGDGYLAEFDYSQYAGWVYTINDWWASLGASSSYPGSEIKDYNTQEMVTLGDVIRWHFTVCGYGADCGFPSNVMAEFMGGNLFVQEDKSELIFLLAAIKDYYGNMETDEIYETALAVAANPLASAEEISVHEATLTNYINDNFLSSASENIEIFHTLNLVSDISINYVVDAALLSGFDSCYLSCVIPTYSGNTCTGSASVEIRPELKGNYYYFTLNGITAVQINDIIEATLVMEKDDRIYTSDTDEYSVATYAYAQLNKNGSSAALKALCAELLRYGAKTQIFKGYRTEALADAGLSVQQTALLTELESVTFGSSNKDMNDISDPTISWVGKSLDLNSKVTLKYIIDATGFKAEVSDLCLHVSYINNDGQTVSHIVTDIVSYDPNRNWYAFEMDSLLAAELRTVVSAAVYSEETQVSTTMVYSADTYGNNKSGDLLTLCKALFAYSDSAKAFFLG